jgi:hypothetical protein
VIAITFLGAINTVIAGVLALIKGQGLPDRLYHDQAEYRRLQDWLVYRLPLTEKIVPLWMRFLIHVTGSSKQKHYWLLVSSAETGKRWACWFSQRLGSTTRPSSVRRATSRRTMSARRRPNRMVGRYRKRRKTPRVILCGRPARIAEGDLQDKGESDKRRSIFRLSGPRGLALE